MTFHHDGENSLTLASSKVDFYYVICKFYANFSEKILTRLPLFSEIFNSQRVKMRFLAVFQRFCAKREYFRKSCPRGKSRIQPPKMDFYIL